MKRRRRPGKWAELVDDDARVCALGLSPAQLSAISKICEAEGALTRAAQLALARDNNDLENTVQGLLGPATPRARQ